jgi:hypothetical protein
MTRRTELQHRVAESKAIAMNWLGNRLFSFKRTGIDGFLKRRMLPDKGAGKAVAEDKALK